MRARFSVLARMESASLESRVISRCSSSPDAFAPGLLGLVLGLELRVVALPLGEPLVRNVQHLGDGMVEQLQVVAHDEQRAPEAGELVEQPTLSRPVEVVGGLVEDHELGLLKEHAHEVDPASLAAREGLDVFEEEFLAQAEAVGEARHDRLRLVAAVALELLLQIGEQLDVLLARLVGQRPARRAECVVEHVEAAGREDVGEPGRLQAEPAGHGGLGEVAERAEEPDVAVVAQMRGGLADQHGDERRLPGAVAPDEPHLLPGAHHERGVGQEGTVADLQGQARSDDHGTV